MRGTSIGNVRVYLVANESYSLGSAVWEVEGDQGETWHEAEVVIPPSYYANRKKFHVGIHLSNFFKNLKIWC